jgi:hypothetical protein
LAVEFAEDVEQRRLAATRWTQQHVRALSGLELEIREGEFIASRLVGSDFVSIADLDRRLFSFGVRARRPQVR